MLTLTMDEWARFRDALKKIDQKAADEFRDAIFKLSGKYKGVGLGQIPREDLINYAFALATKYGEASAAVSAEMYDAVAALQGMDLLPAVPASTASYSEVAKMVDGILKKSVNEEMLIGGLTRLVKMAGTDTTLMNAHRDRPRATGTGTGRHKHSGARVAWVPSGDTCAFCIALAARGWQSQTEWAANNHSEHIHSNCDCTYMVRFNDDLTYEGYDPEKYREMYDAGIDVPFENEDDSHPDHESVPWQKINGMRRANYAQNKDKINAQHREAYALRKQAIEAGEIEE